ncbi:Similar to Nonsense-mediated mRNA decay protein 2; acc. no. O13824 [Pyronema omphalodes CBS 100304]|uniref:Similar to Nonsense-mediated mRNA decay protein 2 acc. no. O13824 n=1 Tax=Pyronema omphalodes (strain CBS 100304) TaxID=1076935 RepID=U4LPT6_PYROM|nr:Similar to Nonsense-mediated mRNA decay protein 2; acc. no. O13824 [Pyronema omphalodes CBS 100304]
MSAQITRARKRELRSLNQAAWEGDKGVYKLSGSLDTSLKKNTAVIKRLRTSLNSESQGALIKDIQTTSLEKYLSEVISAVAEGLQKSKIADTGSVIEVVSALHQRFGKDFTPRLTFYLAKGLANPRPEALKGLSTEQKEREEKERFIRQRALLRVGVELWLVGVIRTVNDAEDSLAVKNGNNSKASAPTPTTKKDAGDSEPFPLEVLKELLGRDKEHVNLPLVVLFVKQFAYDVLGLKAKNTTRRTVEEDGTATIGTTEEANGKPVENGTSDIDPNDPPLSSPEIQQRFRNVFTRYMESLKNHIVRDHERLQSQSARNAEAYIKSGEIFEDRQANYEKAMKQQEKLISGAQSIADVLGVEMPELRDDTNSDANKGSIIREGSSMFANKGEEGKSGIWEDEDQRRFYEDLIDLKGRVPAILLEDGKKKKKDGDSKAEEGIKHAEEEESTKEEDPTLENPRELTEEEKKADDASMVIVNKTIGAQVDALLLRLPELNNRDMIDQAAIDFCFLNSKASRNRLIRVLQDVPRFRQDLLPTYSRLTATLNKYLPDIGKALVEHLDKEFRSLQRRKEKDLSESRSRNARYLSELTKFGVVPEHVIFHCLKVAIEDFHRVNVEIICHILENCGRFLLRTPETSGRMIQFLETLKKKKDGVHHLGPQERIAIENAFYYVNPPERPAITQKQRSVMELFVRKMIYLDLNKRNYIKTLKNLRKLDWSDPEIVAMLKKIFTKVWKVRFNNIHILAIIISALNRYHQDFAYGIIDEILEQITVGLEENNFKHNQRRIAQVKYLGELYTYKMVDSPVIFDALYRIITFGHEGGLPKPGVYCPYDPFDDFFRIRLVCTLLDVTGACFERGAAKKKLDFFLAFLQYYYYTKDPAPMDIDFLMQDTIAALRPTGKFHSNLEEAGKAFEEAAANNYKSTPEDKNGPAQEEVDDQDEESSSSDEEGEEGEDGEVRSRGDNEQAVSDGEEDDDAARSVGRSETPDSSSDEEEENIVVKREQHFDPEEEADFDREFAKMMSESLESRKFERKPVFDVPLPIRRAGGASMLSRENTAGDELEQQPENQQEENKGTMMFSLLTRRGNRQQTKMVALPSDSGFAVAMKDKREKEREEKQKIKELVMSYDRIEEPADIDTPSTHAALNAYMRPPGRNQPRSRKLSMSDVNWT